MMLVVDGCFWACPYEYRFFDFSDPMNGWPELKTDEWISSERRQPAFNTDGTITCFQSECDKDAEDDDAETPVAATRTFRREDTKLVQVGEWVSEKEQAARKAREEANKRYDEWLASFRAADPLYLAMLDGIKDPVFSPENYDGVGLTYDGWCPDFELQEQRMCRRIVQRRDGPYTISLEWGVDTGPVKLDIFKDGARQEPMFFVHSADGVREALAAAKALVVGASAASSA